MKNSKPYRNNPSDMQYRLTQRRSLSRGGDVPYWVAALFVTATLLIFLLCSCERRELYVYGDEFKSVTLDVDWRDYQPGQPDGMTVWFYPIAAGTETRATGTETRAGGAPSLLDDGRDEFVLARALTAGRPHRFTTASVRHYDLYLGGGLYQGVVVSYSPDEYSRQQFLDMDDMAQARIELTEAYYQPDDTTNLYGEGVTREAIAAINHELYSEPAWTDAVTLRPDKSDLTGYYIVANQPEDMALDTLDGRVIEGNEYGEYIPWKERDTYQSTITIQELKSVPHTIIWKLRVRVWVKEGFNYLWQQRASLSGMADGHYLPRHRNTSRACLLALDDWGLERVGENSGWLSMTLNCLGLRPESILPTEQWNPSGSVGRSVADGTDGVDLGGYFTHVVDPDELRINLSLILRDHKTVLHYHFNVGDCIKSYDNQLVLRLDVGPEFFYPDNPDGPEPIVLPYVDAFDGTGFDAVVTPWQEEDPVDVQF